VTACRTTQYVVCVRIVDVGVNVSPLLLRCMAPVAQGQTLMTEAAFSGAYTLNQDLQKVLAVEMLLDRPSGQAAPAPDACVVVVSR
jgi:hypothetical protein